MSEKMIPLSFEELLLQACKEYQNTGKMFQVPLKNNEKGIPVGPAAGPHTQLAENIVAAYAAGAAYFELKTVQLLYGEKLGIQKPCIYVKNEVFNTEWSSELSAKEAMDEYIKAFLLIHVLKKEFGLKHNPEPHFIMSVGYDLKGIRSEVVDSFLDGMKDASHTEEWQKDIAFLRENQKSFQNLSMEDIEEINAGSCISDTVTLSTMHGCPAGEIEQIIMYLLEQKGLHTLVKMNPTLIGEKMTEEILCQKGYETLSYSQESFDKNITMTDAVAMIERCGKKADFLGKRFGVKMTNTFPVFSDGLMKDETMYMSGPALYPLAITAVWQLAEQLQGKISISYSGGADEKNVSDLLEAGISPVTVSSVLLKPDGYRHISKMIQEASKSSPQHEGRLDLKKLEQLAEKAWSDAYYNKKESRVYKSSENYSSECAKCKNCVDVCPNRANVRIETENGAYVLHRNRLCNACGCCSFHCVMGHEPYLEKLSLFEDEEEYRSEDAARAAILYLEKKKLFRKNGEERSIPEYLQNVIQTGIEKGVL